ncbi:MAG: type VII toxin-antitoxin system HepT family RNase toxin [Candidatus Helarchaeota archaeon]
MFDEEGIIDHIIELEEAIRDWERYKKIPLEALSTDRDKRNMVLHALLIAIQSTIDIANHIIAEQKFSRPNTYRESFEILANENIITPDLSNQLANLVGFRNVLIHIYLKLNMEIVHSILQNDLPSIKSFLKIIKGFMKKSKTK